MHVVQPTGDTLTVALRQLRAVGCSTCSPKKTTTAGEPDCSDYDDLWPATRQMCTPESTRTCEEGRPRPALQKALLSQQAFTIELQEIGNGKYTSIYTSSYKTLRTYATSAWAHDMN